MSDLLYLIDESTLCRSWPGCDHEPRIKRPASNRDVALDRGWVVVCTTCNGDYQSWPKNTRQMCPVCRGGLVLNPETVEAAGKALYEHNPPFGDWDVLLPGVRTQYRRRAEPVLWMLIGETET